MPSRSRLSCLQMGLTQQAGRGLQMRLVQQGSSHTTSWLRLTQPPGQSCPPTCKPASLLERQSISMPHCMHPMLLALLLRCCLTYLPPTFIP